jgi:hypothetical protein
MRVGEPISTAGLTGHDMPALSEKVHQAIVELSTAAPENSLSS